MVNADSRGGRGSPWPAVLAISCVLLAGLAALAAASAAAGVSPRSLLSGVRASAAGPALPGSSPDAAVSYADCVADPEFGVLAFEPPEPTAASVAANGDVYRIRFRADMDRGARAVESMSVTTVGDEPLGWAEGTWEDARTYAVDLGRALLPGESVELVYRFRGADGRPFRAFPVTLRGEAPDA